MATTKNKAVAKVEENGALTATEMPDFMKGHSQEGLEGLDNSDFVIPYVKLLQSTDIIVQEGNGVAGEFYHTVAKRPLGKEILFVPVFIRKRYMLFKPSEDNSSGTTILARADDGIHWSPAGASFQVKLKGKKEAITWKTARTVAESGLDKFGSSDVEDPQSRPAATMIYDVIVVLPEHQDLSPALISMKGAAIQKVKSWVSGLKYSKSPIYGLVFKMHGSLEKNGNNAYWAYNITGEGFVKDEALFNSAKSLYDTCKVQKVAVVDDIEPEEVVDTVNSKY